MDHATLESIPCVRDFLALDNDLDRFDYLADLALTTPTLDEAHCTEENRIPGCDSGLYAALSLEHGRLLLLTQSGSLYVKGLGAMLAAVLAAYPAEAFAEEAASLADLLYIRGLIPPERRKGLAQLEERVTAFLKICQ